MPYLLPILILAWGAGVALSAAASTSTPRSRELFRRRTGL